MIKRAIEDKVQEFCLGHPGPWSEGVAEYFRQHPEDRNAFDAASAGVSVQMLAIRMQRKQMAAALEDDEESQAWLPFELPGVPPIRLSVAVEVAPNDWRLDFSVRQDIAFRAELEEKHRRRAAYQHRTIKDNTVAADVMDRLMPGASDILKSELRKRWNAWHNPNAA